MQQVDSAYPIYWKRFLC